MKMRINHVLGALKAVFIILFVLLVFPFARLFLWHKRIWIISEHGYEARDNGYSFFKYMRTNQRNISCYYAIDFNSIDYPKLKGLGNIIKFGSFKHIAYYCAAKYIISSKTQGFCPSYYLTLLRKKTHLWGKYIFLQHGITKDDQKFLYKKQAKIDLFICGAKPEYDDIKEHYGYRNNEVVYTGFARFDDYFNLVPKKQILVMPTWRRYVENKKFEDTYYFRTWSAFINSNEINSIIKNSDYKLYFYIHPQFKEYASHFNTKQSNIVVIPFEASDLQVLIRESAMFITDFSSLAFDFGYMSRPVIYYQYDEKEYFNGHYIKGYFDYRRNGFGPVCNSFEMVCSSLKKIIQNNLTIDNKYLVNKKIFFPICDKQNSERIFKAINNMGKH